MCGYSSDKKNQTRKNFKKNLMTITINITFTIIFTFLLKDVLLFVGAKVWYSIIAMGLFCWFRGHTGKAIIKFTSKWSWPVIQFEYHLNIHTSYDLKLSDWHFVVSCQAYKQTHAQTDIATWLNRLRGQISENPKKTFFCFIDTWRVNKKPWPKPCAWASRRLA